ncbi:MAG: putative bifunctional diguanylate cyclase/phosphodiesterase [Acidimicrobiales bacterium]
MFVACIVVLGGATLVWDAGTSAGRRLLGPHPAAVAVLIAGAIAADLWTVQRRQRGGAAEVTGSWTFVGALVLLATPVVAALAAMVAAVTGDLARKKPAIDVVFNAATVVASLSVAALILRWGPAAGLLRWAGGTGARELALVVGALAGAFAVNLLLTATGIAIDTRLTLAVVLAAQRSEAVVTEVVLLALAPIYVVAAERSLLLLPPLMAANAVVLQTTALSLRRRHDATHDPLTGLANRRLFDQSLDEALAARPEERPLAVVLVDLDDFKAVNDGHGHAAGDRVLVELGARLQALCRPADLVARLGGDEFAVLLPDATAEAAAEVVERLRVAVVEPIDLAGRSVVVGASAGAAVAPWDGHRASGLLRRADEAMYAEKYERGRAASRLVPARRGSSGDLGRALAAGELRLDYQPVVEVATGEVTGLEALLRWHHPTDGVLCAAQFIGQAERSDLVGPLTAWVLHEAVTRAAAWSADGRVVRVGINIFPHNLADRRFPGLVQAELAAGGVHPSRLVLELADGRALTQEGTRQALGRLRELGVVLALDDFGVGPSTIAQLCDLPVDQVKLDGRWAMGMVGDDRDAALLAAVVRLAGALGRECVAEGVEDAASWERLCATGCPEAQGRWVAPPMAAADVARWMDRRAVTVEPAAITARP